MSDASKSKAPGSRHPMTRASVSDSTPWACVARMTLGAHTAGGAAALHQYHKTQANGV